MTFTAAQNSALVNSCGLSEVKVQLPINMVFVRCHEYHIKSKRGSPDRNESGDFQPPAYQIDTLVDMTRCYIFHGARLINFVWLYLEMILLDLG